MGRLAKNSGKLRQLLEQQALEEQRQHEQEQQHRAEEILARIRRNGDGGRGIRSLVETALDFTEQHEWMTTDQKWGYFYALLERAMSHHE